MEVLGLPPEDIINASTRKRLFFDSRGSPRCITNSKGRKRKPGSKTIAAALRCNDNLFIDFVSQCLEWDPKKRITPDEACRHEWLQPSTSSTYIHAKQMRDRSQHESPTSKTHPLTPNSAVLPEIKMSSAKVLMTTSMNAKQLTRDRSKGGLLYF